MYKLIMSTRVETEDIKVIKSMLNKLEFGNTIKVEDLLCVEGKDVVIEETNNINLKFKAITTLRIHGDRKNGSRRG